MLKKDDHERFMRLALDLALKAQGKTSPNPLVGAVVVRNGKVVGEGYHKKAGADHAEVMALKAAGTKAKGATLYVTLEPCAHEGRTPPCYEAILKAEIAHVVVAMRDPNPKVRGGGNRRLQNKKIIVDTGLLREEARAINKPFIKSVTKGLPWVVAKVGQSLDGKIALPDGESRWITGAAARKKVHELRTEVDAIVVGAQTVRQDNPSLTSRTGAVSKQPVRVIVEGVRQLSPKLKCFKQPPRTILFTPHVDPTQQKAFDALKVEVVPLPARQGRVSLTAMMKALTERQIQSVLIEGGGQLLANAFAEKLIDEVQWYVAPMILGGETAPTSVAGEGLKKLSQAIKLKEVTCEPVGEDWCFKGRVVYPGTGRKK